MLIKLLKKIIVLGGLLGLVGSLFLGYQFNRFQHEPIEMRDEAIRFIIPSGNTVRQVAQKLADSGYIKDPVMFIALARLKGESTVIKAGEYLIQPGVTPDDLIRIFSQGDSVQHGFTIIEGWTFDQLLDALANDPILVQTIEDRSHAAVLQKLGLQLEHPEGWFLPDTYHFPRGTTDVEFLRRAHHSMQRKLDELWPQRDPELPLETPYDALILASIIEKETGAAFERPLIAAAFIERLRRGMRLQTDPTIIYGLGQEFDGDIRYRDLRRDTPYNTYLHRGLTPTPIALPGADAIHAALHPAESDAIYFVSKGDGTHHFSTTLEEHNRAVSKYQLKGRKPRRQAEPG